MSNIGAIKLCLTCFVAVMVICNAIERTERIVDGTEISLEEAPFMVQLRNGTEAICGGTLVTLQHVVTAAHCFMTDHYSNITVVGGANLRNDTGEKRSIVEFHQHPDFKMLTGKTQFKGLHADVAVLKLDRPFVPGPMIQVHNNSVCTTPVRVNDTVQIYGWGVKNRIHENSTEAEQINYSNTLRTFRAAVKNKKKCRASLNGIGRVTNTSFCAYTDGQDACRADSGGPGMRRGELCGLVSWGYMCAVKDIPGIYTDLYALRHFIIEKIKPEVWTLQQNVQDLFNFFSEQLRRLRVVK